MDEHNHKYEKVENELAYIATEITALGDMIPCLFLKIEDMEKETPEGIKLLLTDVRKRIDALREYIGSS